LNAECGVKTVLNKGRKKEESRRFNVSVEWHLKMPVCRTYRGVMRHLCSLPLAELMWLCSQFDGSSIGEAARLMWAMIKAKKNTEHRTLNAEY
jgi:hypothetical protein